MNLNDQVRWRRMGKLGGEEVSQVGNAASCDAIDLSKPHSGFEVSKRQTEELVRASWLCIVDNCRAMPKHKRRTKRTHRYTHAFFFVFEQRSASVN